MRFPRDLLSSGCLIGALCCAQIANAQTLPATGSGQPAAAPPPSQPPAVPPAPAQAARPQQYAPPPQQQYAQPQPQPYQPPPPGYSYAPGYAAQPTYPTVELRSLPAELPYKEGQPVPWGYTPVTHARKGLVIWGVVLLAAGWSIDMIYATDKDFRAESGWLAVPLAGPFIAVAAAKSNCESSTSNCAIDRGDRTALALTGVLQVAGAGMTALGIGLKTTSLIRSDLASATLVTGPVGTGYGARLVGEF